MPTYYLYRKSPHTIIPLGETSFQRFYVEDGWFIFNRMIENNDQSIHQFDVHRADSKGTITIEDFLIEIDKYEIMLDR